jgi:hypothetical protein
MDRIAFK